MAEKPPPEIPVDDPEGQFPKDSPDPLSYPRGASKESHPTQAGSDDQSVPVYISSRNGNEGEAHLGVGVGPQAESASVWLQYIVEARVQIAGIMNKNCHPIVLSLLVSNNNNAQQQQHETDSTDDLNSSNKRPPLDAEKSCSIIKKELEDSGIMVIPVTNRPKKYLLAVLVVLAMMDIPKSCELFWFLFTGHGSCGTFCMNGEIMTFEELIHEASKIRIKYAAFFFECCQLHNEDKIKVAEIRKQYVAVYSAPPNRVSYHYNGVGLMMIVLADILREGPQRYTGSFSELQCLIRQRLVEKMTELLGVPEESQESFIAYSLPVQTCTMYDDFSFQKKISDAMRPVINMELVPLSHTAVISVHNPDRILCHPSNSKYELVRNVVELKVGEQQERVHLAEVAACFGESVMINITLPPQASQMNGELWVGCEYGDGRVEFCKPCQVDKLPYYDPPVIHMCTVEKSQCEVTVAYDPRIAHPDSEEYKIEWMEIGFYDSSNSWSPIHHSDGYDFSPNVLVVLPPSREPVQRQLQVAVKYVKCLTPVFSTPYAVDQQPISVPEIAMVEHKKESLTATLTIRPKQPSLHTPSDLYTIKGYCVRSRVDDDWKVILEKELQPDETLDEEFSVDVRLALVKKRKVCQYEVSLEYGGIRDVRSVIFDENVGAIAKPEIQSIEEIPTDSLTPILKFFPRQPRHPSDPSHWQIEKYNIMSRHRGGEWHSIFEKTLQDGVLGEEECAEVPLELAVTEVFRDYKVVLHYCSVGEVESQILQSKTNPIVSPVIHMCTVEKSQCEVTVAYDPRIAHLDSEEYKIEWMEIGFYDSSNSWHSIHHKDGYDFSPNVLVALPPSREPVQRHLQVAVKYDNCLTPVFSKPYTVNQQPIDSNQEYLDSYRQILATQECVEMWFLKVILLGFPRLGKTTMCRRLTGEIDDISSSGEGEQPSTGILESGPSIVVRNISSTTALITESEWLATKNLTEETCAILQYIHSHISENKADATSSPSSEVESETSGMEVQVSDSFAAGNTTSYAKVVSSKPTPSAPDPVSIDHTSNSPPPQHRFKIPEMIRSAVSPECWKEIAQVHKDTVFLNMGDTGGHPEFMDMHPALTLGPALYLFFCKLTDDLDSLYKVSYLSPLTGESTVPRESAYTAKEVLFSSLASIACFRSSSSTSLGETTSSTADQLLASCNGSIAYIIGTHKDLVSEEQIDEFDEKLKQCIRPTDFFREDIVQFSSEERMVLPIDNMHGGSSEVSRVRRVLEESIKKHFKKLSIPASWLVLSLCLRKMEERMASLESVQQLANELGIPENDVVVALWFLHHYVGVLMYFPNLPELKDTVICDNQIIYDSVTNLIVNTFKFRSVGKAASERFRMTGQFILKDIRRATAVSGDYIPLEKLVKLLAHLNILVSFMKSTSTSLSSRTPSSEEMYFMPSVLQNATHEEMARWWDDMYTDKQVLLAPLFITYQCGFMPIGVFPAMIAYLTAERSLKLRVEGIKKNRVEFQYGRDFDTITLVSQPTYYAVHISRRKSTKTPTHEVCATVRGLVESTLKTVTSRMNYTFSAEYQLGFECPSHPGREHLCVVDSDDPSPHIMCCHENMDNLKPVDMQSQHLVWFGECSSCEDCISPNPLAREQTADICKCLYPLRAQWKVIGTFLSIDNNTLKAIKADSDESADRLTDMISEWLRNCEPSPTYQALAEAVQQIDPSKAKEIRRIFS